MHIKRAEFYMKNKINEVEKHVKQLIEIAEEDLTVAKLGLSVSSSVSYRIITFHAQQCAEKYLKAFLVFNNSEFPYTHNITTLIDLCARVDNAFENLRSAEILSSYATANTYPGEFEKLKKSDAVKSVKLSEKVASFVKKKLKAAGF
jgi:HEPN domain-containing protein